MKRVLVIDGIRGLAVFVVVLFHFLNNSYQNSDLGNLNSFEIFLMKITSSGWCGVDLFFVLSGYLIGSILISNKQSDNFFRVFYIRRFLRILPIYFLFLISYIACRYFFFNENLNLFEKSFPMAAYFFFIQNFLMSAQGHFGPNALTPTWSLAVEEQFYLIIPFIIYYLNKNQIIFVCLICVIFSFYYRSNASNWYEEYTHFISRIDAPFLGIVLAILRDEKVEYYRIFKSLFFRVVLMVLLVMIYTVNKSINHLIISTVFVFLIDYLLNLSEESHLIQFCTRNWILILGKYSFFIYLFHQLINGLFFAIFQNDSNPNLDGFESYLIEFFSITLTVVLARLSYRYVESQFMSLGHRLHYKPSIS
jgi:peptidoglycan/LPS O-acetylase OafA/YrhL